jgi:hypothetical protein
MVDLITGKTRHMPSGGPVTVLVSSVLHLIVLGVILLIVPMLFVANILPPAAPAMMAFVAAPPPAPPPPPPPPSRVNGTPAKVVTPNVDAFPVDAPSRIDLEPAVDRNLICRNLVSSSEKIRDARGIFDVRSRHSAELPAAVLDLRRIYRSVTRYSKCSLQCIMAAISFAAIGHRIMEARHLRGIQPRSTAVQYAAR